MKSTIVPSHVALLVPSVRKAADSLVLGIPAPIDVQKWREILPRDLL